MSFLWVSTLRVRTFLVRALGPIPDWGYSVTKIVDLKTIRSKSKENSGHIDI